MRAFESKLINVNDMKSFNDADSINDKDVNNIAGQNLPHYILNPSGCTEKNKYPLFPYSICMYEYLQG